MKTCKIIIIFQGLLLSVAQAGSLKVEDMSKKSPPSSFKQAVDPTSASYQMNEAQVKQMLNQLENYKKQIQQRNQELERLDKEI